MTYSDMQQWTVGAALRRVEPVGPSTCCGRVLERLLASEEEQLIPVVDDDRPVGMIERTRFLLEYSRPYRPELYARSPATVLMERSPLVIDAKATLEYAQQCVAHRFNDALPAGFIGTKDGSYAGICTSIILARRLVQLAEFRNVALERARKETLKANAAKSQFMATISHELRTPLNAIIGFSEIMQGQLLGPVGQPRYAEYVGDINTSANYLLGLINELLDFSSIEAGKLELNEEQVPVAEMVGDTVRLLSGMAEKAELMLNAHAGSDDVFLHADGKRLRQVLFNLLTNAIKFTPPGGRVGVTAELTEDGAVRLRVEDTGIGIAPEDIPKALAAFGRVECSYVRSKEGTGLGLPLAKHLVESHGGTLELESTEGIGTVVTVTFPSQRTVPMPAAQAAVS